MSVVRKLIFIFIFFLFTGSFFVQKAYATISSSTDTITTSRPSAAAPLNADVAASATQIQVVDVPGASTALFLASDSAVLQSDTGQTQNIANVASMSAQQSGTPNFRYVYFTSGTTVTAHHKGTAVVVPITATHKVQFTTTPVVGSGHIVLTFPGTAPGPTTASPSATTFSFNGLTSANASTYIQVNGATCSSWTISAPTMDCLLNGTGIASSTTITILIGCTTQSSGSCTAFSPRLINPTKSNTTAGVSDAWKLSIKTQDNNGIDQDTVSVKIATVEAVQVQATVEPTITFTIAGIADNTTFNSVNTNCALNGGSDKTNSGIAATATNVNLGLLNSGNINTSGQTLTVSTNGSAGYAITATSSGHFINPASGIFLADANVGNPAQQNALSANDTPAAAGIVAGTANFGISPCGARVTSPAYGGTGGIVFNGASASTALFTNPWNYAAQGFYATIASYSGGPVTSDQTVVRYGAAVSGTTAAGVYTTVISYVATATF